MAQATPADYAAKYKELAGQNLSDNPVDQYREILGLDKGILDRIPSVLPSIEFVVEKLDELIRSIVRAITGAVNGGLHNLEEWALSVPILGDIVAIIKKVITGEGDIELPPILQGASDFLHNVDRMLGQLIDVFNGLVVTPINDAIAGVIDWFAGLLGFRKNTSETVDKLDNTVTNQGTIVRGVQGDVTKVKNDLVDKASIADVPNDLPMWQSLNPLEDASFPRIMLNRNVKWVNDRTENGGGNTHWHGIAVRTAPFYAPSLGVMELGFIRVPRSRTYNTVGVVVDNSASSTTSLYLAVYRLLDNGVLSLEQYTGDVSGLVTASKYELRIELGESVIAGGGEYFAVGVLQAGSGTPRPIAGIEMEDVAVPVGTYPPKLNALSPGGLTSPPDTISSGQTNFAYNWAPWVCLGETIPVNVLPKLSYSDDFQRPNSSTLGANWAQRGDIHVTNGAATTTTKGVSSALWVYPLNYNNMSVRATCGTMTDFDYTLLVARGNNTFTRGIGLGINSVGFALVECVGVNQFDKIVGPIDRKFRTGDVVELQCIDDLYIVLHNGEEIYTWRDTGNRIPVGRSFRFVGMSMSRNVIGISSVELRDWQGQDLGDPHEEPWPGFDVYPSRLAYPSEG
ncbi:hypothetical protein GS483_19635 [Rhodococcus hoagii]|nr:hypothetical protein [Prescottella equi]